MCGRYRRTRFGEEIARRYHIPIPPQGTNLLLPWLSSLLQLRYLARHPELSHDQLTPAWIAIVRLRMAVPAVVIAASIAISFFNPSIALSAYWSLLVCRLLNSFNKWWDWWPLPRLCVFC
jgi:hypothetical protein